ncbi:alpha/beta hydrolase family protein [Photobacterium sp. TY1-4]|uniref:alpha/beta hydrolase family protein n=1 Tax=Photobacterium sp. TY1-4 TaxID=2899122 RepID=UPI0021BE84FC|nr:prolyl oligopeptidase family serine peptidase [Photobacterium sp. TY1-4]UXH99962.1 prolyl oligopeptidase family serine peptidase [Photobacterium sp. TY1-4]
MCNIVKATIFFSLACISAGLQASTIPAKTTQTLARADQSTITYYIERSAPALASKALLVLIQGSDCNSVYHNPLINQTFPVVLPGADVLTVEKYGIDANLAWVAQSEREDCPASYIQNDSPSQRVADYQQVLDHLTTQTAYDRVVLLGGSEGAVVANLLASESDIVSQSVALNGGGRWFVEDVLHSMKASIPSEAAYQESAEGFMGFTRHVATSDPFEMSVSGHGYQWWREMLKLDQTAVIATVNVPVMLVQSEGDLSVSPQLAREQARELMKAKSNITYQSYAGLDHAFKQADGTSEVDQVVRDIKQWLAKHH